MVDMRFIGYNSVFLLYILIYLVLDFWVFDIHFFADQNMTHESIAPWINMAIS